MGRPSAVPDRVIRRAIRAAHREGLTANQCWEGLRFAGHPLGRERFYRLWREGTVNPRRRAG